MYRTLYLLTFVALSVNLAHSWDFAVTKGGQLEFFSNGVKNSTDRSGYSQLTALAYDAVNDMLLFVDKNNINISIFSYHLATKQYKPLVRKRPNLGIDQEHIQGIAYDPIQRILFWTELKNKSIYWLSLEPGFKNNEYGNLFLQFDEEQPRAIAVDSCRQYIYWTNIKKASIERAKFDRLNRAPKREVIVSTDIIMPIAITIDQKTKKLYWMDDKDGMRFSIESSDLDGKNRIAVQSQTDHMPNAITVSNDWLYWVDLHHDSVWRINKYDLHEVEKPTEIYHFTENDAFGIVANYTIEDQTYAVKECEILKKITKNRPAINVTFDFKNTLCLHGEEVKDEFSCKCAVGYSGDRCQIYNCHNYCLTGNCSVGVDGSPQCRCGIGYTGQRCDIKICNDYCLNNGTCAVDNNNKPSCKCSERYFGNRCENKKIKDAPKIVYVKEECNCSKLNEATQKIQADATTFIPTTTTTSTLLTEPTSSILRDDVTKCDGGWDNIRDPILMVLGVIIGLLCILCAVLFSKVMQLKKRPRIKKRIIVNKNVTPLTARPDSCEITIENCCNMNICETPCFEPRSTLRANMVDAKPGKEEKKNLIANMEYPEDY